MSPQDRADVIEDWMIGTTRSIAQINDMRLLDWVLMYDNGLCIRLANDRAYATGLQTATTWRSKPETGIRNGHGERPIARQIWDARIVWLELQDSATAFMVDSIALTDTTEALR
jgi:hypothetical protein